METTNITELRKNLYTKVDAVIKFNETVQVATKSGNAVLMSEDDYNSIMETIYLMSQRRLVDQIKDGEKEDISKMSKFNKDEDW